MILLPMFTTVIIQTTFIRRPHIFHKRITRDLAIGACKSATDPSSFIRCFNTACTLEIAGTKTELSFQSRAQIQA